jgi:hypothetical protein
MSMGQHRKARQRMSASAAAAGVAFAASPMNAAADTWTCGASDWWLSNSC